MIVEFIYDLWEVIYLGNIVYKFLKRFVDMRKEFEEMLFLVIREEFEVRVVFFYFFGEME